MATNTAQQRHGQVLTAQAGQMLLFLLTMLLAGMVLSNLVEEKGNKIIEILAAAIPMDAVFLGKLFAMLAVSFVGIAVWASALWRLSRWRRRCLPVLPEPAVGWPLFIALGIAYFAMAYLLIGSLFLAIGSMALDRARGADAVDAGELRADRVLHACQPLPCRRRAASMNGLPWRCRSARPMPCWRGRRRARCCGRMPLHLPGRRCALRC